MVYFIRVRDFMFYVSGLSLLCRDYLLLEIGFWLFYGCFPVKAIWSVFLWFYVLSTVGFAVFLFGCARRWS